MSTLLPEAFSSNFVRATEKHANLRYQHLIHTLGEGVVAVALDELSISRQAFEALNQEQRDQYLLGSVDSLSNRGSMGLTNLERYSEEAERFNDRARNMFEQTEGYQLNMIDAGYLALGFAMYDSPNSFFPNQSITLRAESVPEGTRATKTIRAGIMPGNDDELPVSTADIAALKNAVLQLDAVNIQLEAEQA